LTRALATSGRVSFEEPDPRLSIDPKSGSGIVLPISAGGGLCGLLAIESSRRRDFRDADVVRFGDAAQHGGLAVRLAQFVDWHRDRFGFEVWFEADRFEFRSFASDFLAAARARSPVVLFGPSGSGKSILARWLHFESRTGEGPIRVVHCGSPSEGVRVGEWIRSTPGGTVILENVERLIAPEQDELLRILDGEDGAECGGRGAARDDATTRIGLKRAIEEGRLRDDLSQRLDRLQFRVPALRDRREDVLPLTECLCRRVAREENAPVPSFSDEALALLWRQPWDGNVRELESFVYKLVLLGSGDQGRAVQPIEPPHVLEIARRFSLQMVQRLPSRHPARGDLLAALRVTRKPGGRLNKTRAALYLGWDPDTLVARMQDAGIGEEIGDERAWTVPPAPAEQDAEQPPA
jgi:DNA-binding NtrC family response regulator